VKNMRKILLSRLLILILCLVITSVLYHWLYPQYISLLLILTKPIMHDMMQSISLMLSPRSTLLLVSSVAGEEPFDTGYNLFYLGLTSILAPSLVIATLGLTRQGITRAAASIGIMIVFHIVFLSLVLFVFFTYNSIETASTLAKQISLWFKYFNSTQSFYPLFPFLAWIIVSYGQITKNRIG
jgi:hypothetical protein